MTQDHSQNFSIALVGNPNCGKTTLFNALTGTHQHVGNWPGVTVEQKTGHFKHAQQRYAVVDLPGTYSLHVAHDNDSMDQQIAQQFVLDRSADLIVNIVDASSLERSLYLTTQLLDAQVPMVVALNMTDVADQQGVHVDPFRLADALGCPVVPLVASRSEGLGTLQDVMSSQLRHPQPTGVKLHLGEKLETAIASALDVTNLTGKPGSRLKATAMLESDAAVLADLSAATQVKVQAVVATAESQHGSALSDELIAARYRWINQVCHKVVHSEQQKKRTITDYLDAVFLNRWLAFPLFLGVMYLMFMLTINLGGVFTDFFDTVGRVLFVEAPTRFFTAIGLPGWLIALLADGAGGGMQLVASFIPVIGALFLFQTFLEDSGYMARSAFVLDRLMRVVGLPGKSFVPLIVGFGCNVPSIMATRSLDSQQDRLLTTIMAPFMSCGARLTVYVLFATVFFQNNAQNVVFGLYIIGIALAVLSGFIIRKQMLSREVSPFIMELPNYHIPTLRGLLIHTWQRLRGFIVRAGKAIVLVVIVLNFVNSIGTDGSYGNENTESSVLSVIGKTITPLFTPMGVEQDNWPATVGIFSGIFAKEVVVGTLDELYGNLATAGAVTAATTTSLWDELVAGAQTIPENLKGLNDLWGDPLGVNAAGDLSDQTSAAAAQDVRVDTLTLMATLFAGPVAAFSYILFVLLYMPCVATLGVIYKEMGGFWAFFSASWNTLIAYCAAVICFQAGTFSAHPQTSLLWIAAMLALLAAGYATLLHLGRKEVRGSNLIPVVNL
ncbi:MAG: Fe(2+) transporter permease subunit FeoB [Pseudomonadales bacterium]